MNPCLTLRCGPVLAAAWLSILIGSAGVAAEKPAPREWTAAEGGFRASATFVYQLDEKVALRRADGASLEVRLDRLSQVDRDYVNAQLLEAAKAGDNLPSPSAVDSHFPVTFSYGDVRDLVVGATVTAEDATHRYVVTNPFPRQVERGRAPYFVGPIHALVGRDDKMHRVELEKIAVVDDGRSLLLAAPKEKLPSPFRAPPGGKKWARGDRAWFYGIELRSKDGRYDFAPTSTEVVYRQSFIQPDGKPLLFEVDAPLGGKAAYGVIVDADGSAIARATGIYNEKTRHAMARGEEGVMQSRPLIGGYSCDDTSQMSSILPSAVLGAQSHERIDADGINFEMQVQVFDPTAAAAISKRLRLLCTRTESPFVRPEQVEVTDGKWSNKPTDNAYEIDLTRLDAPDAKFKNAVTPSDWPRGETWTGSFTPVLHDHFRYEFAFRVVVVEADGKYRPLGDSGLLEYEVSDDARRLYRKPVKK